MISAILLCAGESIRMGRPKALLTVRGETFLRRALGAALRSEADEVICVTGSDRRETEAEIERCVGPLVKSPDAPKLTATPEGKTLTVVFNPLFASGMMGSIQQGVRALSLESRAFLVSLVDLPFLEPEDYNILIQHAENVRAKLFRFRFQGIPAHPVLIASSFIPEILNQPLREQGCSFLFGKYPQDVFHVDTGFPRGLTDIDTPEDYHAHITA